VKRLLSKLILVVLGLALGAVGAVGASKLLGGGPLKSDPPAQSQAKAAPRAASCIPPESGSSTWPTPG
jgi:hypothetical protein